MYKNLIKGSAAIVIGAGVYVLCQWLTVTVLARAGGPSIVGLFAFATAITAPTIALTQLGLRQAIISDVKKVYSTPEYIALRVIMTLVAFAIYCVVVIVLGYRNDAAYSLVLLGGGRCAESVVDICYGHIQREGRIVRVGLIMVGTAVATSFSLILGFLLTKSLTGGAAGFAIAWTIAAAFLVQSLSRSVKSNAISRSRLEALARSTVHLAGGQTFVALSAYAPRYIIQHFGGTSMVGIFAAIEYFASAGNLLVMSIGQAVTPQLANDYSANRRSHFIKLTVIYVCLAAGVGLSGVIGSWILGGFIINTFYGPSFAPAIPAFTPLFLATVVGFPASALAYVLPTTGRFRGLIWIYAISLGVAVFVSSIAIPRIGLSGIAVGMGSGAVITVCMSVYVLRQALTRSTVIVPRRSSSGS